MSATKDLWLEEVEQICEQFANGDWTREEAFRELQRKGFDAQEARDMLDEAVA